MDTRHGTVPVTLSSIMGHHYGHQTWNCTSHIILTLNSSGWMDELALQQYLSHFETMEGWTWKVLWKMKRCLGSGRISPPAGFEPVTWSRERKPLGHTDALKLIRETVIYTQHTYTLYSFVCLCWGLTSQSTIFQSCRDGATASWVINQYFRGVNCLAQGHNTAAVGLEPPTSRSGVRHSTTEPPRSPTLYSNPQECCGVFQRKTV